MLNGLPEYVLWNEPLVGDLLGNMPGKLWEFDETPKMFSNPDRQETEDYVTGRFG